MLIHGGCMEIEGPARGTRRYSWARKFLHQPVFFFSSTLFSGKSLFCSGHGRNVRNRNHRAHKKTHGRLTKKPALIHRGTLHSSHRLRSAAKLRPSHDYGHVKALVFIFLLKFFLRAFWNLFFYRKVFSELWAGSVPRERPFWRPL